MQASAAQPALLGVLGGMGPAATADFLVKLIAATPASTDQEHIPTVVCSIPQIPDRSLAILHGGESPLPKLRECQRRLEDFGAGYIAIPCNTAHHWFEEMEQAARVPLLHIVDAVTATLAERGIGGPVGLLGTTATIAARIYERRFERHGIECIVPNEPAQESVMRAIRAIKGGRAAEIGSMEAAIGELQQKGARAAVLACTELPLIPMQAPAGFIVDAGQALADACIRHHRRQAATSLQQA